VQLRRLVALAAVVSIAPVVQAVTWTAAGPAAAESVAACPVEGCGGGGEPVHTHTAELTVVRSVGLVTSNSVGGHAISCGATCTVSDSQATEDADWPTEGWPTYTLTAAGGPAGYSPRWSPVGLGCGTAATCQVANDQPARTVTLSWVDTAAPIVVFSPPPRVGPSGYLLTAGGSDNSGVLAAFNWTVDGVPQSSTGSVLSLAGAAEGDHTVQVRSVDGAGNHSAQASRVVTVDRSVSLVLSPVPALVATAPVLTFTTDDDVVERSCRVDGGDFAPCTSPWAPALGDGTHTLDVRVRDDVGNEATASRTFDLSTPGLAPAPTPVPTPGSGGAPLPAPPAPAPSAAPHARLLGPARVAAGRRVRFTIVVSVPTGTVTWTVDGKHACRTALQDGRATCRTGRLRPGRHVVTASYAGPVGVGALVVVRRAIVVRR
jgi:Big-like domain-containing protein